MKSKSPLRNLNRSISWNKTSYKSPSKQNLNTPKKLTHPPLKRNGIIYLSLQDIFEEIEKGQEQGENFVVKCSYLEIYKESVFDLLRDEFEEEVKLNIYEDVEKNEFIIKGAIEEEISSYEEA